MITFLDYFVPEPLVRMAMEKGLTTSRIAHWWDGRIYPHIGSFAFMMAIFSVSQYNEIYKGYADKDDVFLPGEDPTEIDEISTPAPLYQEMFEFLENKGYMIHNYWIAMRQQYGCNIYEMTTGNYLWPSKILLGDTAPTITLYNRKQDAWNEAIEATLKMIP